MTKLRVFISYAWADNPENEPDVTRFRMALEAELARSFKSNFEVFMDTEKLRNDKTAERLKLEIERSDFFVVFASPSYISRQSTISEYMLIKRVEAEKISQWQSSLAPDDPRRDEDAPYPRIYVVYLTDEPEMNEPSPLSLIVRDLQGRIYFDYRDARRFEPDMFRQKTLKIAQYITESYRYLRSRPQDPVAAALPAIAHEERFPHTADDGRRALLRQIETLIEGDENVLIRGHLIDRLLQELAGELESLNRPTYGQDISVDQSFITRATSIFGPAGRIFAISIDNYSAFWTKPSLISQAQDYTALQPDKTFRLFVFSSPRALLEHRHVLQAHHDAYGTSAAEEAAHQFKGRVLFTTRAQWDAYFASISAEAALSGEEVPDGDAISFWTQAHSSADFGILEYLPLFEPIYYKATLDRDRLRFGNSPLSTIDLKFMQALKAPMEGDRLEFPGGLLTAYRWRDDFSTDDQRWFAAVAAAFAKEPLEGEIRDRAIMHLVLFSRDLTQSAGEDAKAFAQRMRAVVGDLLDIRKGQRTLVKDLWYGTTGDLTARHEDPTHKAKLRLENSVSSQYPHCLALSFASQADLDDYYKDPRHATARRRLYRAFSSEVGELIDSIDGASTDAEKRRLGDALEVLVSRHMVRLDFASRDPFGIFADIQAPAFKAIRDAG